MKNAVKEIINHYVLTMTLSLSALSMVGACRQSSKSTAKADIAAYKFSSIGASVNIINGEVGQNCLNLEFDKIKVDRALTPWQLSVTKVSSHQDLIEQLDTSKGHLLAGSSASKYVSAASQRAKSIGSTVLHPTHEWLLISLTGGPKSTYVAPDGQLLDAFRRQDSWRSFRASCGDGYVSAAQQVHFAHVLIGLNVEEAIDRNSVKESLKTILDAGEYSIGAMAKIKDQLSEISRTYPISVRVIDSSFDVSNDAPAFDEIETIFANTTSRADYGNGKLGDITIQPYENSPNPPDGHQQIASEVLSDLQTRYLNLLDARDLVSYIVNGSERYHQDENFNKAVAVNSEVFANIDIIADIHANCAILDVSCRTPNFAIKDLVAIGAIKPVRKEFKRSERCGVELYKLGVGEVCRGKTPTVYKLAASGACQARQYKLARTEACGIERFKLAKNPLCGLESDPGKGFRVCRVAENGIDEFSECRHKNHGVESYYECRDASHGVELQPCRDESFGNEVYKQCLL